MTPAHPGDALGCGDVVGPVRVEAIAHGGHCVARYQGRVIFVRHALPGEQVLVTLTDLGHSRYWRGDATTILDPDPDRVEPACEIAGPGGCGGCDFQHVALPAQRRLKSEVVVEQFRRLAGIDCPVTVEPVPQHDPATDEPAGRGFGWRTRMRYPIDETGRAGLHPHRSHRVVPLPDAGCRIAHPDLARPEATADAAAGPDAELAGVAAADGTHWFPADAVPVVTEQAAGRTWQLPGDGFWQVHPAAADVLVEAVLSGLDPRPGERAFDLYCGSGLFAGVLADRGCVMTCVESDPAGLQSARHNLADARPRVRFIRGRVDRTLSQPRGKDRLPGRTDLVVLDPPRSGAGRKVVDQIVRRRPRAVAYVACDPAALARDTGYLLGSGYVLDSLRAFDLFPMTHHVECVGVFTAPP